MEMLKIKFIYLNIELIFFSCHLILYDLNINVDFYILIVLGISLPNQCHKRGWSRAALSSGHL